MEPTTRQTIRTIFYADDDGDDDLIFRDALKAVDPSITIYGATNGHDLCALLGSFQPDIVFLDLDMPQKNGLECIVDIRRNPLYASLPIVVYSSTTRMSNIDTAYAVGADLFFIKPSVYADLLSSLKAILQLDWRDPAKVKESYFINGRYTAFV